MGHSVLATVARHFPLLQSHNLAEPSAETAAIAMRKGGGTSNSVSVRISIITSANSEHQAVSLRRTRLGGGGGGGGARRDNCYAHNSQITFLPRSTTAVSEIPNKKQKNIKR